MTGKLNAVYLYGLASDYRVVRYSKIEQEYLTISRLNMDAETLEEITIATKINLANEFFTIPLCLIIIKVIKDYNNVERELFEIEKNKNLEVSDNPNDVITTTD